MSRKTPRSTSRSAISGWNEKISRERNTTTSRRLQLDPRHKSALTNLGLTALEQQQTERARELFRTALVARADGGEGSLPSRARLI